MTGIDGTHALLKMGRAHLCVKRKTTTDNKISAEESYFLANRGAYAPLYATVVN